MAGAGSRFSSEGYKDPKPLILINGIPMIRLVIENLKPMCPHRFIFICQREHVERYELRKKLGKWAPNCEIIEIDGITEGAACTVLEAASLINNEHELMIANSDQYIDIDINDYLKLIDGNGVDGLIMTMKASDEKWSYIGLDVNGEINRVVEKEVISDEATVGIYNFSKGSEFVSAALEMIADNERVNGEFYVAPVYNNLIRAGATIRYFNIGEEHNGMHGLGTPSDLQAFLKLPLSIAVTGKIV